MALDLASGREYVCLLLRCVGSGSNRQLQICPWLKQSYPRCLPSLGLLRCGEDSTVSIAGYCLAKPTLQRDISRPWRLELSALKGSGR